MTHPEHSYPSEGQDISPIKQFLQRYQNNPIFFQDFIHCCPFNKLLVQHFHCLPKIYPVPQAWRNLFSHLTTAYSLQQIADLVFEALYDLDLNEQYLLFLDKNKFYYIWPTGNNFCDPLIDAPPQPEIDNASN